MVILRTGRWVGVTGLHKARERRSALGGRHARRCLQANRRYAENTGYDRSADNLDCVMLSHAKASRRARSLISSGRGVFSKTVRAHRNDGHRRAIFAMALFHRCQSTELTVKNLNRGSKGIQHIRGGSLQSVVGDLVGKYLLIDLLNVDRDDVVHDNGPFAAYWPNWLAALAI